MTTIASDFSGSGALDYYARDLAFPSAYYAGVPAGWEPLPAASNVITIPVDLVVTPSRRLLSATDVEELDRAFLKGVRIVGDIS